MAQLFGKILWWFVHVIIVNLLALTELQKNPKAAPFHNDGWHLFDSMSILIKTKIKGTRKAYKGHRTAVPTVSSGPSRIPIASARHTMTGCTDALSSALQPSSPPPKGTASISMVQVPFSSPHPSPLTSIISGSVQMSHTSSVSSLMPSGSKH